MKLFCYEWKDKWRKRYLFIIYLVEILLLIYYLAIEVDYGGDFLQEFLLSQKAAIFVFVCLIFLSYEIFSDFQMQEWQAQLKLYPGAVGKVVFSKNFLLFLCWAGNFFVVAFIELLKLSQFGYWDVLIKNIVRTLVINFICLPLTGILLGQMFARLMKKRWLGYFSILVLVMLGCGLFDTINNSLYMTTGVNLDAIFRFFQFVQPNATWIADLLYLVPAENYRFTLFAFWILAAVTVLCVISIRKVKCRIVVSLASLVLCCIMAFETETAYAIENYNLNYGTAIYAEEEFLNDDLPEEQAADFVVTKYSMNLTVSDELSAVVTVTLEENDLRSYHFTLYRGYEITGLTDENGSSLEYERNEDYIIVYTEEPLSEIRMSYHGFSTTFFSNSQGIILPGYFAYYPQAGFRQVFRYDIVDYYLSYGFNVQEDTLQSTFFTIQVEYDGDVFSNLEEEDGIFVGTTTAPTLMGGAVMKEEREDGSYMYPVLSDTTCVSLSEIKIYLRDFCELLGFDSTKFEAMNQVIFLSSSVYIGNDWAENVIVDDCLFLGTDELLLDAQSLACEILMQSLDIEGDKSNMEVILSSVLLESSYLDDLEPLDREAFFAVSYDKEDVESESYTDMMMNLLQERMFLTLLETFNQDQVLQATAEYLIDESHTENNAEFMQNLYLQLEEQ